MPTNFGTTPYSTETLPTNTFPVSAVFVPNSGAAGNLTAVAGGPATTDSNGYTSAPAAHYVYDGNDVTLGAKADARSTATDTTAISIMQVLKQISFMAQNPAAVTANIGTTNGLALDATVAKLNVAQGAALGSNTGPMVQGSVTTNAPSYTTGNINPLSLDTSGLLRASLKDTPSNTNNLNVNLAASAATVTVSASGNFNNASVGTVGAAAPGSATQTGGTDGANLRSVFMTQAHNADNQTPPASGYSFLVSTNSGVLNPAGTVDRARGTGQDAAPLVGIPSGAQQLIGPALSTTFNGAVTGSTSPQSVVVVSSANAKVGDIVLTQDNAEYVEITAIADATHVTGIFRNNHASGQSLTWYHANMARDATVGDNVAGTGISPSATYLYNQVSGNFEFDRSANGEKDGASGQGTAVAAEYEYNANPLANGSVLSGLQFDRARNVQAGGLGSGTISNNPLAANSTTLTLNSAPTTLDKGAQIVLDRAGANPETNYVATSYTPGSTSVPLQIATQFSHAQNSTVEWSQHVPLGPQLNGFLPSGLGMEEEIVFDPVSKKYFVEIAATGDANSGQNIVLENAALYNGATFDRQRAVSGDAMAQTGIEAATDMLYNGSTYDRPRSATGDALATTGIAGESEMLWNGSSFDRARSAGVGDAAASTGIGLDAIALYNGSTFDRGRSASGDALATTGIEAASEMLWNGSSFDRARSIAIGDGAASTGIGADGIMLWNGATYDRLKGSIVTGAANVSQQASGSVSATMQNAASANGNGTSLNTLGMATVAFTVSGTFTATVNFEGTEDNSNWAAIEATPFNSTTPVTTTSTTGSYMASCAGMQSVRARISGYSSGNVTVTSHAVPVTMAASGSAGGAASNVNIQQVGGTATVTATAGVQKVGIVGNTGAAMDAAGQNASSPANELLVAGQFNTSPTTITSGNVSPLQLDSSGNLKVNLAAGGGSGGTALADEATFTQGTTSFTPIGGIYNTSITNLTSGQAGAVQLTNDRNMYVNLNKIGGTAVVTGGASGLMAVGGPVASGASNADNPVKIGGVFNTTQPTVTTGQIVDLQATARGAAIVATGVDNFTVQQGGSNWSQNVAQFGGVNISTGTGASGTGIPRVTVSNDSQIQLWDGTSGPVNVEPANESPDLTDRALVTAISPNNTGLPVNLPVIVQKTSNTSSGSVASLAKAFGSNNIQGNSIIVVCGVGNGTAPTISDTNSNTYTQAAQVANGTALNVAVFYAVNIAAGANTVTVNNGGTTASIAMEIYEVSGLLASIPNQPDVTATATGSSGTASTSTISAASPNELAFAAVGVGTAAQTITAGSGWTNDSGQLNPTTPAGLFSMISMSEALDSLKAVTPQATFTSEPWAIAVATFRPVILGIEGSIKVTDGTVNFTAGSKTSANSFPVVIASDQSNVPTNVAQFGGTNVVTGTGASGAGIPRVTVSSDSTVGANSATGSAVPANAFYQGGLAKTALPTAATDGNLTGEMTDKFGRQVVLPNAMRDIVGSATLTLSASTTETTLVAATASVFHDITSVVVNNTSATASRIDFRDTTGGSIIFMLYVPAGDVRGIVFHTPQPQTTVNTNWTAQSSASVTDIRIFVQYISNK